MATPPSSSLSLAAPVSSRTRSGGKRYASNFLEQSNKVQVQPGTIQKDTVCISQDTAVSPPQAAQNEQALKNMRLTVALLNNDIAKAREAIVQGASVQMEGEYTPLHWAAASKDEAILALLLKHDAREDINKPDSKGKTPLAYALENEDPKKGAMGLLLNGADPALLPKEVQQAHVTFFNKALRKTVTGLDTPALLKWAHTHYSVPVLDKKQRATLERRQEVSLSVAQKILKANIPGLDLEPSMALCNGILKRTNDDVLKSIGEEEKDNARIKLRSAVYILRTGLPMDKPLLDQFAQAASDLDADDALVDAVTAGANSEIREKYINNAVDDAFNDADLFKGLDLTATPPPSNDMDEGRRLDSPAPSLPKGFNDAFGDLEIEDDIPFIPNETNFTMTPSPASSNMMSGESTGATQDSMSRLSPLRLSDAQNSPLELCALELGPSLEAGADTSERVPKPGANVETLVLVPVQSVNGQQLYTLNRIKNTIQRGWETVSKKLEPLTDQTGQAL